MWGILWIDKTLSYVVSAPYQLEMQIWQVTRSALVNLSRSGCAPLLLWHGICTQTTVLILLGTWTGSHCFWWYASPCNNRLSLPWFCKPFPKRLKLAGQTKERLSTTCPSTPLSPIKSVVTTCTFNKLPVSFCLFFLCLCFVLGNPNDCVHSHLFYFHSVTPQSPNGFVPQRLWLCFACAVWIKTGCQASY